MKKVIKSKVLSGILAAMIIIASMPETVYAVEVLEEQSECVGDESSMETPDEEQDGENERKVELPDGEKGKEDGNETEESNNDNADGEENESETSDEEGNGEELGVEAGVDSPDNMETDDTDKVDENESDILDDIKLSEEEEVWENEGVTAYTASGNGIVDRLNELKNVYPNGKYWWRVDGVNSSISDRECPSPGKEVYGNTRVCGNNTSSCGIYSNGFTCYQCVAFAYTLYNEIFKQNPSDFLGTRTDTANIMVGDYVRFSSGHSAIVIGKNGNMLTLAESNFSGPCQISWGRTCNVSKVSKFCHATNYDEINRTSGHNPIGTLDEVRGGAGSITVRGWAFDRDVPNKPLTIHVYIGGQAGSPDASCYVIYADKLRPDVENVYPGVGNYHGFSETIATNKTEDNDVYVYALNEGPGNDNPQIGNGKVYIEKNRVKGSYMDTGYSRVIPDGYYHIASSFGDKWWLVIEGISDIEGANVELWDYSIRDFECDEQLFYFEFIDEGDGRGFYKITNKKSGKCLDVAGVSEYMYDESGNPTNVWQWTDNGTSAQQWAVREIDGGEKGILYTLQARCSGFCLDLWKGENSLYNGANISMCTDNGSAAQQWRLVPYAPAVGQTIEDGEYQIVYYAAENKAIGAAENINGANVELSSSYKGDYRQIFEVKYLGNGYYSIINKYSGLSLDVAGAYRALGTNVWLWNSIDYDAQKWIIKPCGNGYYNIISKCNGLYLDLEGGNTKDVNNINMWHWNIEGTNQMWKFASYVPKLTPPTASITSGTEVEAGTTVSLLSGIDGAAIYYTLDGTNPSKQSFHYTKPFTIEKDTIITAYVVKDGYEDSEPAAFTYTVKSHIDSGQGDVLDEDIPQGKVENIPKGLWMSAVSAQVYTGKAIKPQVRVYDHTTLLTEKKDYTISYKNNIKANVVSGANVPTITVTGRGNYIGKEVQTFVIRQKSLSDVDIMADGITLQYNGKVQKPLPVVTWNGKKLTKNKDYTVSYPNEESDGVADPTAYIKSGTYEVLVKGMGNYAGEKAINLTITQSKPASAMTVVKIADHTYTGAEVRPIPVVKSGRVVLTEGEDYEVSYQNNIKVGTATVMITGKGSYAGVKKATFKIVPRASLNKAKAEIEFDSPVLYTGSSVRPDRYQLTVSEKNSDGRTVTVTLTEGTDYEVSYRNDNKAGTAAIIFQGINGYSGSLKKTYKIAPYDIRKDEADLAEADQKIRIELADSYMYVKGGCKPEPVVTYRGKVLTKGTDYTLSYRNCNSLSDGNSQKKMPVVIVKGKGCFKGTLEKTYRITPKEIGRLTMTAADRMWQNKGNIFKTKVVIKDENGKVLNAGKDYERNFTYAYNIDTELSDGTVRYAGDSVTAQDIIPAGTMIRVTAAAKGSNYSGTVSCVYRITKADIGKAVIKIPVQTYTGRAITLENEIKVKLNGQPLPVENYKITGYSNNINKGTATVTISGINDCGGEKRVNFKIKEKGFLWWWR